jgi:predicted secreted hydrolase
MRRLSMFATFAFLASCAAATSQDSEIPTDDLTTGDDALVAARCTAPTSVINLPMDESVHAGQTPEWWYYRGHLESARGQTFGYTLVFFRIKDASGAVKTVSHFAVMNNDASKQFYKVDETTGDYQTFINRYDLSNGSGWSAKGGEGQDSLRAASDGYAIDLKLRDDKGVMINYGTGALPFPDGTANYYYSRPSMKTTGSLTVDGKKFNVKGTTWFDHQWGTLPAGLGWTWFGVTLDTGEHLLLFQTRLSATGDVLMQGGTSFARDCAQTPIAPEQIVLGAQGSFVSPVSGFIYPEHYTVTIASRGLSLVIVPTFEEQELVTPAPAGTYRSAESEVYGAQNGQVLHGKAIVEHLIETR